MSVIVAHVRPGQRQQLAAAAAGLERGNDDVLQVGRGVLEEPLLFIPVQSTMARSLGGTVHLHDRHAEALERAVVNVAFNDGPVEQVPEAPQNPIRADVTALCAWLPSRQRTARSFQVGLCDLRENLFAESNRSSVRSRDFDALSSATSLQDYANIATSSNISVTGKAFDDSVNQLSDDLESSSGP